MVKNMLNNIEEKLLSFGKEVIDKRFGKMKDLYISNTREGILIPIHSFSRYKVKNKDSLPIETQLEFLDKGIWPLYMMSGGYDNPEIKNYHYNGSHFSLFLSSNFGLSYYTPDRGQNITKINSNSILFLREEGITHDMWSYMEMSDSSLEYFCTKRLTSKQKNHVYKVAEKFKDKINHETELDVNVTHQSIFSRY
jgi:hypothetical protein